LALTPQNNEAFLREVDDELRRDQMTHVWRNYGRWILATIVLALALLAGWIYWQHHQETVAGEQGLVFRGAIADLGANKMKEAEGPLKQLAASDAAGYRTMAKFTQADLLLIKNDLKGAAAIFADVAKDETLPQPFRDLALVRQTSAEYDTLQPQAVIDRLGKLAVKDNAWFGSAGELVAAAYLRAGKRDVAGKLYGEIARDETVPASIRQRAVQMAGVLGVDAVVQTEEKKP
jgi:hypothetical protein